MPQDTDRVPVVRVDDGAESEVSDTIVVEEPLEIRVDGESAVVTMRTPGDDFDLAAGFMWTEGWIRSFGDVGTIAHCPDEQDPELKNSVDIRLLSPAQHVSWRSTTWVSSSCGLCGKATIEAIRREVSPLLSDVRIPDEIVFGLPGALFRRQSNFRETGGIHAAGLFDVEGRELAVREDIGRHNAVDKVVGALLREDRLGEAAVLMVSGRLGFEIAQKALMAGVPIVASVSAPSSLAVSLAVEFGLTTVGFLRGRSMNIYSRSDRIITAAGEPARR
jgi:FdhD protein